MCSDLSRRHSLGSDGRNLDQLLPPEKLRDSESARAARIAPSGGGRRDQAAASPLSRIARRSFPMLKTTIKISSQIRAKVK